MEIREKKLLDAIVGYVCDICDKSCSREDGASLSDSMEHAILQAEWGYWSHDKDGTAHECHMCELCYDKVRQFIEENLKGKVRVLRR